MKRGSICVLISMLFIGMIVFGTTLCHADSYHSVYDSAFEEALYRSDAYGGFGDYNVLSYTMGDITGDGIDELIFHKSVDKHLGYFWVYGCANSSSYYMGEVEEEAANQPIYGYRQGFIFTESYKGWVALYNAAWNGESFTKENLYEGSYDRDYEPPAVTDLAGYYDPERLLDPFPDFLPVSDREYLDREMVTASDGFGYDAEEDAFLSSDSAGDMDAENASEQNIGDRGGSVKDPSVYNSFLSNFAMMDLWHFDSENVDVESMMDFITCWLSRTHTTGYIEWGEWPRISLDNLNLFMEAFTGLTFTEEDAANGVPDEQFYFYEDGYFYRKLGDGESTTDFCVVKDVKELEDGNLEVGFSVFSLDLDRYFEYDDTIDNYLYMGYEEASNSSALTEIGYGTAILKPVDGGMYPFQLVKYDCVTGEEFRNQTQAADTTDEPSVSELQSEKADFITAALDSDEPFISWDDAGISDHEIIFNDPAAEEKIRGLKNKWDGPVYLSELWNLTELDLTPVDENHKIQNIDFVQELRNLTVLNLNYNDITDISPVKHLTQLEGLFLNSNPVSDISVLASMPWIARLDLSGTRVEDYTPLKGMTGLKTLHLYDDFITNDTIDFVIDCIVDLPKLKKLNLGKNVFDDYSALARMKQIKTLSMWDSGLDDERLAELAFAISDLPKLKTLSLSNNHISDVSCLASLKHLKKLIINNNPVNDFSSLGEVSVETDTKDPYTEKYLAYARQLQEEAGETLYMAIVRSDDPILLITDRATKIEIYNETIAVDCDAYQYSKSQDKMVYIGKLKSGGTASPLRTKDKSVRFSRHHDAYTLTAKDGKAIVYAIHNANMDSDEYPPDKTKYTLKNDEWTEISSKTISKKKADELHAKYIEGDSIDFKEVE